MAQQLLDWATHLSCELTAPCPSPTGSQAEGVIHAIGVLNAAVGKMVTAALWVSPLGIGSLIAASILKACDLAGKWGAASDGQ